VTYDVNLGTPQHAGWLSRHHFALTGCPKKPQTFETVDNLPERASRNRLQVRQREPVQILSSGGLDGSLGLALAAAEAWPRRRPWAWTGDGAPSIESQFHVMSEASQGDLIVSPAVSLAAWVRTSRGCARRSAAEPRTPGPGIRSDRRRRSAVQVKGHTVGTRRLTSAAAIVAAVGGITAAMLTISPARADVSPDDADARFISVGKHSQCATIGYTAEGYLVDSSGNKTPDSTWHTWDGNVRGCQAGNDKAVFAWQPANANARIDLTVYLGDDVVYAQTVPGDQNFCLLIDDSGQWKANWSSDGGGGSGACTAD
jgi:hypothetical protein